MINEQILEFCENIINLQSNAQIVDLYKQYLHKFPFFKDYTFIVGTNDSTGIKQDILRQIANLKYDGFSFKSSFLAYDYTLILNKDIDNADKIIDISIYVDSNAFDLFVKKDSCIAVDPFNSNPIAKFIYENNLDINPQLYIHEDFFNKWHTYSFDDKKELEIIYNRKIAKLRAFFEFQNLDIKDLSQRNEIVGHKMHYFLHNFLDEKSEFCHNIDGSIIYLDTSKENYWFDFIGNRYVNHTFIYSYLLLMFLISLKNTTYDEKILEFAKIMRKSGPIFLELLCFAYEYFKDKIKVQRFMNFDIKQWSLEEFFKEAKNKAWDIFHFYEIQNIEFFKNKNADFALGFFLSRDKKFDCYTKISKKRISIINKKDGIFTSLNSNMQEINDLFFKMSFDNTKPRYVKDKNLIALSLILKNNVENSLTKIKMQYE